MPTTGSPWHDTVSLSSLIPLSLLAHSPACSCAGSGELRLARGTRDAVDECVPGVWRLDAAAFGHASGGGKRNQQQDVSTSVVGLRHAILNGRPTAPILLEFTYLVLFIKMRRGSPFAHAIALAPLMDATLAGRLFAWVLVLRLAHRAVASATHR